MKRFEIVMQQHLSGGIVRILRDKQTGIHYIMTNGLGFGGITPLLDADGKVVRS